MRKFVLLMILAALGSGICFAQNASDFKTDGNGVITNYTGSVKDVVIPSKIGNEKILVIGPGAFRGTFRSSNYWLTSVTIPDSVTSIGEEAFSDNRLISVTIPNSVTAIGGGAFSCKSLTAIQVESGNTRFAERDGILFSKDFTILVAFPAGKKITSYSIPDSVTSIGKRAFAYGELTSITIPNSVTSIDDWAFYSNQLTSVTIPNSVTSIGDWAFDGNNLTGVTIPNSVTSIGNRAFDHNKLTNVTIPNSVTSIGLEAFSSNKLTSVTIGNGVTSIGVRAFSYNQLTSVTIPDSVISIEWEAFDHNKLTSVTIPNSVTSIGGSAFSYNQLTGVTIPNSVKTIGNSAFGNNKLTSVTIPGSVTSIGWGVFDKNQLTSVTLGTNLVLIEASFNKNLFIDYMANSRKAGTYQIDTMNRTEKRDGDFGYIETKYGAYLTSYYGSSGNRLMIPEKLNGLTVTAIGYNERGGAFEGKNISRITIPNSVTSIGRDAFAKNQLTSVTIPNSVTHLSGFGNNQLTSVIIPDSVTSIGASAFGNNQLTSVTIPDSVTSIGDWAFGNNKLTSVTIPDRVTSLGRDTFAGNQLTSVVIGKGVISIAGRGQEGERGAFAGNQLTSVTIPDSVAYIGWAAFGGNNLTSVTMPANVNLDDNDEIAGFSFPHEFDSYYDQNGKKAGTYRYDGRNWSEGNASAHTSSNTFSASHRVATNDKSNLRLRNSPSTSGAHVTSLAYGTYVQVLEIGAAFRDSDGNSGNWMRVRTQDGQEGWCFGAYLTTL